MSSTTQGHEVSLRDFFQIKGNHKSNKQEREEIPNKKEDEAIK